MGVPPGRKPVSLRYRFTLPFHAPAPAAFEWCIDFAPEDGRFFPERHLRTVRWFGDDAAVLTDTTFPQGRPVRIRRLVRVDREMLSWTNTHLDGPYVHSQYWYQVVARGARASALGFTGHRLLWPARTPSASAVRRLTDAERRADSTMWRTSIAPALERDLARRRST
jgi:hypothetical protein